MAKKNKKSLKKESPKKIISKKQILNIKKLYGLLVFLRDIYPIGYSMEGIKRELNIDILTNSNVERVIRDGLIEKRNLSEFEKETLPEKFKDYYPEYLITSKGMEFINTIETQKLNKNIKNLTIVLVILSIGMLAFSII